MITLLLLYLDNPYIVAQNFVEKYNLAANTLNDRPIVTLIANKIMDHTATHSAPNVDKKSTFNPYKGKLVLCFAPKLTRTRQHN